LLEWNRLARKMAHRSPFAHLLQVHPGACQLRLTVKVFKVKSMVSRLSGH
jgi:hypothetical protein